MADDDLFLLALTRLDERQVARRALRAESIDSARLLQSIRVSGDAVLDPAQPLTFAPAYYQLEGRAQGFAAARGDSRILPEDVLLSLMWDPGSRSSHLVWRLGASRQAIVEQLRDLGSWAPAAALPPQRETEWGDRVCFDRNQVRRVIDHLRGHIPPGACWGFNYEGGQAWVIAEQEIDLNGLVQTAIGRQSTD